MPKGDEPRAQNAAAAHRTGVGRRATAGGLVAVLGGARVPARAAGAAPDFGVPQQVAPGVFVLTGAHEEASAANANAIANVGFVVGRDSVAVVDPGGSLAHGRALRGMLEAITPLPVRHVVLTHVHPDHCMGATAFADLVAAGQAEVIGHARLPAQLAAREVFYRELMSRQLGEALAAGSAPLPPTRLVTGGLALDLGGRALTLRAHGTAHTDHDLSLRDEATGTLWLSDLLFVERCPSVDGSIAGWLARLEELRHEPAVARAVPGHGPASVPWPAGAVELRRYLGAVREGTRAAMAAGVSIAEAPERVARKEASLWRLAEVYHGRNVTSAYRELEWE